MRAKSEITIQINSLPALERLIGGDSKLEVDIRNSVVQRFAEKHLKAIVYDHKFKQFTKTLSDEMASQLIEYVEKLELFSVSYVKRFTAEESYFKAQLTGKGKEFFSTAIRDMASRVLKEMTEKTVKNTIDNWTKNDETVKYFVNQELVKLIKDKMHETVDEYFKGRQ